MVLQAHCRHAGCDIGVGCSKTVDERRVGEVGTIGCFAPGAEPLQTRANEASNAFRLLAHGY